MHIFTVRSKKLVSIGALVLILALAGGVARAWQPLRAWYYTRGLARATDTDRAVWVERIARLDRDALPGLLGYLHHADSRACVNVRLALAGLVERWEPADPRRVELATRLAESFAAMSIPGQQATLELQTIGLQALPSGEPLAATWPAVASLLAQATRQPHPEVRAGALALATRLVGQVRQADVLKGARELTQACLGDEAADNRIGAVRLALRPEVDLLEQVVPLLNDPVPEVRRTAMLAVGPAEEAIRTDYLLRWLHDADADVRKLCEKALRSRGLREEHLKLGRLITDARPRTRLQVLEILPHAHDLEPGVWLRHLSHDPEPAVRAAALRAAAEQPAIDLTDRIGQMAENDPSATIRQLARHYLSCQKAKSPPVPAILR